MSVPSTMKQILLFTGPRRIFFGLGCLEVLPKELSMLGAKRLLIVTDENIVRLGYIDKATALLNDVTSEVFDKVEQEPSLAGVEELASKVRKRDFDAVLGIGGGSAMDTAKIASLSATNPGHIADYLGTDKVQKKGLPLLCAPTTSGTGSEVTRYAVVKDERTKRAIVSDLIIPDTALVDPALTVSMPPKLTSHTGLDALSHAVEAMISTWATPLTDTLALGASRWVFQYLKKAYLNGDDIEARCYMALAATTAGLSFNDPRVLLAHSIGQTIGPIYNIPHGLSAAVALPYMLDFYLTISANKIARIGEQAGAHDPEKTPEENAQAFIDWLFHFYRELNVPFSLRELGIPFDALEKLSEDTLTFQPRRNTPIPLTKKNVLPLYEKMWRGKI